jgi:hypothetical protein
MIKSKILLLLILCCLMSKFSTAQESVNNKKYEQNPVWIQMMDDSTANYFEAITAYDIYWKKHEKPIDEEGELMNDEKGFDWNKIFFWRKNKEAREMQQRNWLRYQCKRFEWWKKENLTYVQPDGRILTMQERVRIFNQSQTNK